MDMIILALSLALFKVEASVNPNGPTVTREIVNCLNNVIEKNFNELGLLVFATTESDHVPIINNIRVGILRKVHESARFSVEVSVPGDKEDVCGSEEEKVRNKKYFKKLADYYIVVADSFREFSYLMSTLINSPSWNAGGKFLILFMDQNFENHNNMEMGEKILSCLFRYNAVDVLVATPRAGNIQNVDIYSWKPYDPPKYCGYFNETAKNKMILENTCERGIMKEDRLHFNNKIPTNMWGCDINILAIEIQPYVSADNGDPNIEKKLITEMLRNFNYTVNYEIQNVSRGEREDTGHWNGGLKSIVTKKKHILLGGIFPDFDVHEDFESSSSFLADSYTWVVPRAFPFPPWASLTIVFKKFVWCSLCAGFVVCVISWKVIGIMSGDTAYHCSWDHCVLNTCIVSLGFPTYIKPVKRSLQILFVFLNIYCMVFTTAYEAKLIAVLQNPVFEQQLDTIEELVESGLKFGGTEVLRDIFIDSTDPFDNLIFDKWTDIENLGDAMINVAVYRNFSVLCSRLELAHLSAIMPELYDSFGKLRYYAFETNTFSVPVEMISLKGYPFMESFSRALSIFKQSGFNDRVRKGFATYNLKRRTKLLLNLNVQSKQKPLSVLHLEGGFLILLFGSVSGIVVFFIEIIINVKFFKYYISK